MFLYRIYPKESLPLGARPLSLGCKGRDVQNLQRALAAAGYLVEADGRFGYATEDNLRKFQAHLRLSRDGVAGPATIAALHTAREGTGFLVHRVRLGEDDTVIAKTLGVTVDSLRRHNQLRRRDKIIAGRLLSVPARILLLGPDETCVSSVKQTAVLGPVVTFDADNPRKTVPAVAGNLPWFTMDRAEWRRRLHRADAWTETADHLRHAMRDQGCRQWLLELPAELWRYRRRLLRLLTALTRAVGQAPLPVVIWPNGLAPLPDLAALRKICAYMLLDPGPIVFSHRSMARLLRQATACVGSACLIPIFRGGGLARAESGVNTVLPLREARIAAVSGHLRLNWDEEEKVYQGNRRGGKILWEISLLEERGLRERVRLADRFACAGVVLRGLAGMALPTDGIWPGEFAVLDNFPTPPHID